MGEARRLLSAATGAAQLDAAVRALKSATVLYTEVGLILIVYRCITRHSSHELNGILCRGEHHCVILTVYRCSPHHSPHETNGILCRGEHHWVILTAYRCSPPHSPHVNPSHTESNV
jgi:hypothetical protein